MLLTVRNDLRIEREKRNVSPFYEVRIPYDAEILSGGNICRPFPADGGIWYFVDINKKV